MIILWEKSCCLTVLNFGPSIIFSLIPIQVNFVIFLSEALSSKFLYRDPLICFQHSTAFPLTLPNSSTKYSKDIKDEWSFYHMSEYLTPGTNLYCLTFCCWYKIPNLDRKEFFLSYGSREIEYLIMGRPGNSWAQFRSLTGGRDREHEGQLIHRTSKPAPTEVLPSASKVLPHKDSITSPDSTNWTLNVQTHEPMVTISHKITIQYKKLETKLLRKKMMLKKFVAIGLIKTNYLHANFYPFSYQLNWIYKNICFQLN